MSNMGERVLIICKEKGITPAELERAVDVGNGSVKRWVKGAVPSGTTLEKIATKYGVSADWLLGLSEYRSTEEQLRAQGRYSSTETIAAHLENVDLTDEEAHMLEMYIKALVKNRK